MIAWISHFKFPKYVESYFTDDKLGVTVVEDLQYFFESYECVEDFQNLFSSKLYDQLVDAKNNTKSLKDVIIGTKPLPPPPPPVYFPDPAEIALKQKIHELSTRAGPTRKKAKTKSEKTWKCPDCGKKNIPIATQYCEYCLGGVPCGATVVNPATVVTGASDTMADTGPEMITCSLCFDEFHLSDGDGSVCEHNHFVCWRDCMPGYISAAMQPDAIHGYVDRYGNLTCPTPKCKSGYSPIKMMKYAPYHIREDLFALLIKIRENRAATIARAEIELKYKEEFEKLRKMDEHDKEIYHLRKEIVDDILTPHCPSCGMAFIDFDGCFALTCYRESCRAKFCAWCTTLCPGDAHPHVLSCTYGNGTYYGDFVTLETVRNRIRKEKIEALMKTKSAEVKARLKEVMKTDFDGLKLVLHF